MPTCKYHRSSIICDFDVSDVTVACPMKAMKYNQFLSCKLGLCFTDVDEPYEA